MGGVPGKMGGVEIEVQRVVAYPLSLAALDLADLRGDSTVHLPENRQTHDVPRPLCALRFGLTCRAGQPYSHLLAFMASRFPTRP
jgi:hypothetical protein